MTRFGVVLSRTNGVRALTGSVHRLYSLMREKDAVVSSAGLLKSPMHAGPHVYPASGLKASLSLVRR